MDMVVLVWLYRCEMRQIPWQLEREFAQFITFWEASYCRACYASKEGILQEKSLL